MSVAIYFVEERVFKMGSQENESATEKTIDNRSESAILSGYKSVLGKYFPNADRYMRFTTTAARPIYVRDRKQNTRIRNLLLQKENGTSQTL